MSDPKRPDPTDDLEQLLAVLPADLRAALAAQGSLDTLLEVVLDLGRRPEARFATGNFEIGAEPRAVVVDG